MKRPSYREGVEFIALNDDPNNTDPETVMGTLTVGLLSALFGVTHDRVASDVVRFREKQP
jgi:hypothetical protein